MTDAVRISPADALAKMSEGYTYVDVRSVPEFTEGHPEGAVNVPYLHQGPGGMTPNPEFLEVMKLRFPKDAKIILGCRSGGRSLRALGELVAEGFTNVVDQRAGWDGARDAFGQITEPGWSRANLPSTAGNPKGTSYEELRTGA
ncbi:MAG: rhodanese-like domain-containing protein [Polyangiaceae bacterium]